MSETGFVLVGSLVIRLRGQTHLGAARVRVVQAAKHKDHATHTSCLGSVRHITLKLARRAGARHEAWQNRRKLR